MNAVAEIAREKTDIVALVDANPVMVLTDKQKYSDFYNAMKAECDAHVPDLTTEAGRKKTASIAYKVARTKTAIDDAGKKLNEEARARINAVDESRREIRQQLDELRDEVRKPLTEWEAAEEKRVAECNDTIDLLRRYAVVLAEDTADGIREDLTDLLAIEIDADKFEGLAEIAENLKATAVDVLTAALARAEKAEADAKELERLRAETLERERIEEEKRQAEESERQKEAAAKAAAELKAKEEAEQQARIEAAAKAAEEAARAEAAKAHAEALAAEKARADALEAAAKAESARAAREAAAQKAEADRQAAEKARREADQAHRTTIMGEVKRALMTCEVTEPQARAIVLAIVGNNVPHTSITF